MRLLMNSLIAGAVALTAVGSALADPPRRGDYRYDQRYDDHRGNDRYDNRRDHDRYDNRRDDHRWNNGRHWKRGDRFDRRDRYVVVDRRDYGRYHLRATSRGHYYARTDTGDILLVAAATGLIIWALNN